MEELVGAMSVGFGSEDSGDHELGIRELLGEFSHERDGSSHAVVGRSVVSEVGLTGLLDNCAEFGGVSRGIESSSVGKNFVLYVSSIGRVGLEDGLHIFRSLGRVDAGGESARDLQGGEGSQNVSTILATGDSVNTNIGHGRSPCLVEGCLDGVDSHRLDVAKERSDNHSFGANNSDQFFDFVDSSFWDFYLELLGHDTSINVLNPIKKTSDDAVTIRDDSRLSRVDSLLDDAHLEVTSGVSSKRGGH